VALLLNSGGNADNEYVNEYIMKLTNILKKNSKELHDNR
jgi:hypothetical protein